MSYYAHWGGNKTLPDGRVKCSKCLQVKLPFEFFRRPRVKALGRWPICKECDKLKVYARRKKYPEKDRVHRDKWNKLRRDRRQQQRNNDE